MGSRLDHIYRSLLLTKFFTRGWGQPEHLVKIIRLRKQLGSRATAQALLKNNTTINITKEEKQDDAILLTGTEMQDTSPLQLWNTFQKYVRQKYKKHISRPFYHEILPKDPDL